MRCLFWGTGIIRECTFHDNHSLEYYADALCFSGHSLVLEDSHFIFDGTPGVGALVDITAIDAHLSQNVFEAHAYSSFPQLAFCSWGIFEPPGPHHDIELVGNVVWNKIHETMPGTSAISCILGDADIVFSGNTFVRADIDLSIIGSGTVEMGMNILLESGLLLGAHQTGAIICNDSWPDSIQGVAGYMLENNINVDPLFCDEEIGDLRIAYQSPCAEENSPEGCGMIGALPAECDLTPVERISWGEIKAGFK